MALATSEEVATSKELEGVFVPNEDGSFFTIDFDRWRSNLSPARQRQWDREAKARHIRIALYNHVPWMSWPVLRYVYAFWGGILEEGIYQTCKPRWGAVTFGYLNDGIRPSLWHTWQNIMHPSSEYARTLYPKGAPRNKSEADAN